MMRVVSLVLICLLLAVVSAQEGGGEDQVRQEKNRSSTMEQALARLASKQLHLKERMGEIPATLAEAHAELERILTEESLAMIDGMDSEDGMVLSHHGFGTGMRNAWGLWGDSVLARHMKELGFTHADDMSGVILATLWCKRHGRDFRLEKRAARFKKLREEEEQRIPRARAALRSRMMGLRFEKRDVPKVTVAVRNTGVRPRFLWSFRDGVFLTAKPGNGFYTQSPYYFDPTDRQIHRIGVPEVNDVYTAVVAGERAWFVGLTDGHFVLAGIGAEERITVPLPDADGIPGLGLDGESLLAIYSKTIYRLEGRAWTVVHSGDMLLPRSSLPPQRYGDTVFFRDEEDRGGRQWNRLWWLTMGNPLHLSVLDRDLEVIAAGGPQLREVTSCCLTGQGDLWVCTGKHYLGNCLLRRSKDGSYSIATLSGSVRFLEEGWPETRPKYEGAAVSAVRALPDETLLLAGRTGLYRLGGDELVQELAFTLDRPSKWVKEPDRVVSHVTWRRKDGKMVKEVTDVVQKAPGPGREVFSSVPWLPNNVLLLDDGSYFLSTDTWEGAYWIRPDAEGQWSCLPLDEGDPVVW